MYLLEKVVSQGILSFILFLNLFFKYKAHSPYWYLYKLEINILFLKFEGRTHMMILNKIYNVKGEFDAILCSNEKKTIKSDDFLFP